MSDRHADMRLGEDWQVRDLRATPRTRGEQANGTRGVTGEAGPNAPLLDPSGSGLSSLTAQSLDEITRRVVYNLEAEFTEHHRSAGEQSHQLQPDDLQRVANSVTASMRATITTLVAEAVAAHQQQAEPATGDDGWVPDRAAEPEPSVSQEQLRDAIAEVSAKLASLEQSLAWLAANDPDAESVH